MAKTAMIIAPSGDGKSTSIIVNPNGTLPINPDGSLIPDGYEGMDPQTTVIYNCDGKELPFPYKRLGWTEGQNLFTTSFDKPLTAELLEKQIIAISANAPNIKAVIIDTVNGSMNDKEMLDTYKMTYDKWYDLAKDFYRLMVRANTLRDDLIIYFFGHVFIFTDSYGQESRGLVTNGKKLEKIQLETKIPIVLHTSVKYGADGKNEYTFETQKSKSTGKTPYGMFDKFLIPNSLKLVDGRIRAYYSIN